MIDIATAVAAPLVKGAPASATSGKAAVFETALSAFTPAPFEPDVLLYADGAKPAPVAMPAPTDTTQYADLVLLDLSGKRQRIAGGGKDLPVEAAPVDLEDGDASKDVIWSPVGMALPLPLPQLSGAVVPSSVQGAPLLLASPAQAGIQLSDAIAPSQPSPDRAPASAEEARDAGDGLANKNGPIVPVAARESAKIDLPIRIDATAAPVPQQSQPAPITQLAGRAFAAAIAAVVQSHRDEREPGDTRAPLCLAAVALEGAHKSAVAATVDARRGALDLRRDSGLQGMIDRIETLRDDANAGDTRIRLVPDALGAVDVSVRKDGERVHVHFNADNPASARLLSEAQPRLADLAEARGVKLGQTTVGSGVGSGTDSGAGNARQRQPTSILPTTPAAILAAAAADITDTRIA